MKLGEMANVRSGLVLSRKQARGSTGIRYPLLNLRSISAEGSIDRSQLDVFDAVERLAPEYVSRVDDVVVRMSSPYTAVLIDETSAGIVISSNFIIIHCNKSIILPEYLFWLLNRPETKRAIYENTSSNMLGAVKAKFFTDFDVLPLSMEDQRKIAAMNALAIKETQLLHRLACEKEQYYNQLINNIYEEMKRGQ
jgi:restriction endonuclease S subunit